MLDKKKGTDKGQEQKASKNVQSTGVERKHPCETLCPSEGEIPGEYWVLQTSSAAQRHLVIGTSVPQNKPHGLKALPFCFLADGSWFKLTPSIPSLLDANMYPGMERGWKNHMEVIVGTQAARINHAQSRHRWGPVPISQGDGAFPMTHHPQQPLPRALGR